MTLITLIVLLYPISYIFLFLFFLLLITISLIYQMIIKILIKIQYKDASLMSSQDSILACGKSTNENLLLYSFLCTGTIDIDLFRSILFEKLIKQNYRSQCYVEHKFGYYFWLKEKEFNINDHVLYHPNLSISTKDEWEEVQVNLYYNTPFPHDLSPWFVHFVPVNSDYEEANGEPCFYMVTSYYQCIGDGFSVLYQYLKGVSDYELPNLILSTVPSFPLYKEILFTLRSLVVIPYYYLEYYLHKKDLFSPIMKRGSQISVDSGKVNTEHIKIVRRSAGVPFRAVLLSCIVGALQKFFKRNFSSMPSEIVVSIPQVLCRSTDEISLTNNFVLAYFNLPLNQNIGMGRLKEINTVLNSSYTLNSYLTSYLMMKRLGNIFPSFIGQLLYSFHRNSVMLSIAGVHGFPDSILNNRSIKHKNMKRIVNLYGNVGIVFQTITNGEDVSISVHSKSTTATKTQLKKMLKDFEEELQVLMKAVDQQTSNN